LGRTEVLACFDALGEGLTLVGICKNTPNEPVFDGSIISRGLKLHQWFHTSYFFQLYKPALGVELINNNTIIVDDFGIILRSLDSGPFMLDKGL
jgi:hypothetical protein